jgi:hypothetical protein
VRLDLALVLELEYWGRLDVEFYAPHSFKGTAVKKTSRGLLIAGLALIATGVVLRILVDGNLVQIPVIVLIIGGFAMIWFGTWGKYKGGR